MAKTGRELGFELRDLYDAGKRNLPAVAKDYKTAKNGVSDAGNGMRGIFTRPAQFGGPQGSAYSAIHGLRAELEHILHETEKSLELTGEALVMCANEYAKSDQEAGDEFRRLERQEHNS